MTTFNSLYPIIDTASLWPTPLKETYQFLQGFFHIGDRCYRVVKYDKSVRVLKEDIKKQTWQEIAFKAACVATVIIPLVAAAIAIVHWATHTMYFKLQVAQRGGSQATRVGEMSEKTLHTDDEEERYQTLKKDAAELVTLCDRMVDNYSKASEGLSQELQAKIASFERLHRPHLDKAEFKSIQRYQAVKNVLAFVSSFNPRLFIDSRFDAIKEVPGDGNCLFHSLSKGLQLAKNLQITPTSLRQQAVEWMRANKESDETLKDHLASAIENFVATKEIAYGEQLASLEATREFGENEKTIELTIVRLTEKYTSDLALNVEGYLELAGQESFFGSLAEIYAISMLYQVQINIYRVFDGRLFTNIQPPVNPNFGEPSITVVHRNGNHFDLYTPQA